MVDLTIKIDKTSIIKGSRNTGHSQKPRVLIVESKKFKKEKYKRDYMKEIY